MCRFHRRGLLVLLTWGIACSSGDGPVGDAAPPEADAVQDLGLILNQPNVGLLLGEVRFVVRDSDDPPDMAKGEDALSEFPLYVAFAQRGIITILDEQDVSGGSVGRPDLFALRQQGVQKIATISRGPDSTGVTFRRAGDVDQMWLAMGLTTVDRIVSNDTLTIGVDRYRVIQGMFTSDIPIDLHTAVKQARGFDAVTDRTRRFKALVKFDPFDQHWQLTRLDVGPADTGITTENVDQEVHRLSGGQP